MDCRALAFRQLPHQSKLFLTYLDHFERVKGFYGHPPTMEALKGVARKVTYPKERRKEIAGILRQQNIALGGASAVLENLTRLENGAVAIVSGQQVGLFSGPAYAIYKALTAIQFAQELTRAGIDTVPVFWLATEDHDVDEIRHATFFHSEKLKRFELPAPRNPGKPVGQIKLGPEAREAALEAAELLSTQGSELLAEMVRSSYAGDETYGSAFGKLFVQLFGRHGLILLDPLDPGLHRVAAPVYLQAAAEREALNAELLERGKKLDRAGFAAQVKVTSRSTLLFYMGEGSRQVITVTGGKFQAGSKSWTPDELSGSIKAAPECFSPNALFRPVVQDYLLPTAGYVAGPSEISYFAQSEVVYRKVLGRMPVVLPRAGFTLVDAKAAKLLAKYKLDVEAVWDGPQKMRERMEAKSIPKSIADTFETSHKQIARMLARLEKQIATLDPTLKGATCTARNKISYQLEKLRRKAGRAQDLKSGFIAEHERYLESLLYPHKQLQSRELCLLPFLARWGPSGLDELQKLTTSKKCGQHLIVQVP